MSMTRKARRKNQRKPNGQADTMPGDGQEIKLVNPESGNFEVFIAGNAHMCVRVVEQDSAKGQHLVLCGAGPSLNDSADEWCRQGDQLWGCNSALTWLADNGHNPTHGFCIDQTTQMLVEWATRPDVEYLIASSVHPHLTQYLMAGDRKVRFFHNWVGLKKRPVDWNGELMSYEDFMYCYLFRDEKGDMLPTVRAGSGLNSVPRAVDVARYMGFERITVLGADCAVVVKSPLPEGVVQGSPEHMKWLENETVMHADGGSALASGASPLILGGEIDGRRWETKADMMVSAVILMKMARDSDDLELIGDTLPNALKDKPQSFLDRLPTLTSASGDRLPMA